MFEFFAGLILGIMCLTLGSINYKLGEILSCLKAIKVAVERIAHIELPVMTSALEEISRSIDEQAPMLGVYNRQARKN